MKVSMGGLRGLLLAACAIAGLTSAGHAEEAAAERAMRRGVTMFWYDRAAWVTSDDILARLPAYRKKEVGGWIVVPGADGYHVYFHGKDDAADSIVYEADVIGNQVSNAVVRLKADAPRLPGQALAMAKALRIAWAELANHADWQPCANARFNTVVLPPEADGSIPVYFLTPQTETNVFPFGGHFEVVVASDGTVASSRRFTNTCLNLPRPTASPDRKPAAMVLTHLLDPQPTEVHIFQQFAIGMPLYVVIASTTAIWKVENGAMSLEQAGK